MIDLRLPERLLIKGLKVIRGRAHQRDPVGDVAYRSLQLVHPPLVFAADLLGRLGQATALPRRAPVGPVVVAPARPTPRARRASQPVSAARTA